ncbi:MAG TPA: hypothetical protein VFS97_13925 [Nitrososphaeraceae archaeon]|nr:hypothetical protein [Nitrososphaeraceae archaeon]
MEVYESIARIVMGFIPTIVVMEITYRIKSKFKIVGRNEIAATGEVIGGFIER